jgi:hypothetical protein
MLSFCLALAISANGQLLDNTERFSNQVQVDTLNATVRITVSSESYRWERRGLFGRKRIRIGPFRSGGLGSGVIVKVTDDSTYILTANHVTSGSTSIVVEQMTLVDGVMVPKVLKYKTSVVASEPGRDLSLIRVMHRVDCQPVGVRPEQPPVGIKVLSSGCDNGDLPWLWEGTLVGDEDGTDLTDRKPWHGRSGGPLVDQEGRLVGICSAYSQWHGLFKDAPAINALLRKAGIAQNDQKLDKEPSVLLIAAPFYCSPCERAKSYLKSKGIKFDVQVGGGGPYPRIRYGDKEVIGFNPAEIDRLFEEPASARSDTMRILWEQ